MSFKTLMKQSARPYVVFKSGGSFYLSEIGLLIWINRKVSDRFHQGSEDNIRSFVKSGTSEHLKPNVIGYKFDIDYYGECRGAACCAPTVWGCVKKTVNL